MGFVHVVDGMLPAGEREVCVSRLSIGRGLLRRCSVLWEFIHNPTDIFAVGFGEDNDFVL